MNLPIIPKKFFDLKSAFLPGGKITLSPFSVGQESILLQVKESEDEKEKIEAIKQVIDGCNQTKSINSGSIPMFMIEEIFLRLRQNSVGELVDLSYRCTNEVDNAPCGNVIPVQIDLREFKMKETEGHTNTILIADPIGIRFKYPTMDMFQSNEKESDDVATILGCIDVIYDSENVYNSSEYTSDQLLEFWNQLTLQQKKDVYDKFFLTMPHLHYKKIIKCKKCGHDHEIEFNSSLEVFL